MCPTSCIHETLVLCQITTKCFYSSAKKGVSAFRFLCSCIYRTVTFLKNDIDFSKSHPDKRVGKIFDMRYIEGKDNNVMPWRMISDELSMSIQGVINIHNSAIENFKHKLEREEVIKC